MSEVHTCPKCKGLGKHLIFLSDITPPCKTCNETGKVDDLVMEWIKQGNKLKYERIEALISLHTMALMRNMDVVLYSDIENGAEDPAILEGYPLVAPLTIS